MEYGKFSVSFTYISSSGPDFSQGGRTRCSYNCTLVCQCSKHVCFTHSPTSHLMHFTKTFFVTHLALHTRHLSCVSDRAGQCLLLQTSSLARYNSTFGGLPNGLSWPVLCSSYLNSGTEGLVVNVFINRIAYH